ncbi:MAG: alpha/beta hydrolase [Pseudomonadota bacterium]
MSTGTGTHWLDTPGARLAYTHQNGAHVDAPGLFFLPGFRSSRAGLKATHLGGVARAHGLAFTSVDYRGHGDSGGDFESGDIGLWTADALAVLQAVPTRTHVLVGSSMGAWIAVRLALAEPARVHSVVTVAAAPDFTEDLLVPSLSTAERAALARGATVYRPSAYGDGPDPISPTLIEGSRAALVLRRPIDVNRPLRALHGARDLDVPLAQSEKLVSLWACRDRALQVIEDGDHRLSRDADLSALEASIVSLLGD